MSSAIAEETSDRKVEDTPISPIDRRNSLEKHLQQRPDVKDLKNRNILPNTNAAPSLQAAQIELERNRNADSLRKHLEKRPEREELVGRNILPDSNAAPALQANQKSLERHMRADSLEQKIQQRPDMKKLVKGGILQQSDENVIKE